VKILVLNYEFPPVGGGGGRACADLCQALAARGHEIKVLTSHAKGLARQENLDGYHLQRVLTGRRSYSRASLVSMAAYVLGGVLPALSILKRWKPEIMHVHFAVPTGALAYLLHKLSRKPYILTAHLGDVPGGVPEKTDRWFRFIYPFTPGIWKEAAAIVAVSDYTRNLAMKHYDVEIRVIPNGVKLPEDDLKADRLQVSDPPRIVFAGRFQPQKNLLFLIDALSQLKDLPWGCTLIGDGPQRAAIESRINDRGLADRIHLTGWIHTDEVWQSLGQSDVLVMPSLSEGLPVVGVHALAHGLAIIANRAGGLSDLVEDEVNGRLCSVGDENCFVDALRWTLQDPLRLLQLRRKSLMRGEQYNIDHVADAYEKVFGEKVTSK
jgi:glycosyltransferase involved in cell wall biosynthesis